MIALPLLLAVLAFPARAASPVVGTVVTSDEWIVHREPKGKTEEFTGHVRYHAGPTSVDADWALYRHASKKWHAKGRVVVRQEQKSGDILTARGDDGVLYEDTQSGRMTAKDRVTFERQAAEGGTDHGEADEVTWEGRQKSSAVGRVRTWGPRGESWSDRADYEAGRLTLTGGRPVVRKFGEPKAPWNGVVKADVIVVRQPEHRLDADGRAEGWMIFPASERGAKKGRKGPKTKA